MQISRLISKYFRTQDDTAETPVPLSFPPPFKRMVAVNGDVEFTSWTAQIDLIRIFAERDLECAFSYWFFGDPEVTWHLFDDHDNLRPNANAAFALARGGLLDTIHSFGGVANGRGVNFDRARIQKAFRVLQSEGIVSRVYSNHGTERDTQNVGGHWVSQPGTLNYQQGDIPGTQRYHLDMTLEHGARYFWLDIDRARETVRFVPSLSGRPDDLFTSQTSRNGQQILRFRRTDAGVMPDAENIAQQINRILDAPSGGYTVIYTHLGVARQPNGRPTQNPAPYLSAEGYAALDRLAKAQREGDTLVTTTSRLLDHALIMAVRPWKIKHQSGRVLVEFQETIEHGGVQFKLEWTDLEGFTLPVDPSSRASATLGGSERELSKWFANGEWFAGFPWQHIKCGDILEGAMRLA